MGCVCGTHIRVKKFIQRFGRKIEVMTPLGRNRRGWQDNIKMDLNEIGYDMEWIKDRDQW